MNAVRRHIGQIEMIGNRRKIGWLFQRRRSGPRFKFAQPRINLGKRPLQFRLLLAQGQEKLAVFGNHASPTMSLLLIAVKLCAKRGAKMP